MVVLGGRVDSPLAEARLVVVTLALLQDGGLRVEG